MKQKRPRVRNWLAVFAWFKTGAGCHKSKKYQSRVNQKIKLKKGCYE